MADLRRPLLLLIALGACKGGEDKDPCTGDGCGETSETGETGETGDPSQETGETGDSGETGESGDTGESGHTGDSSVPIEIDCTEPSVQFAHQDGTLEDLSDALLTGTYVTLDEPGTLMVCPRTWFARLLLRAEIDVIGLGDTPEDTVLSAGESGTILDVGGAETTVSVSNLTLDRGAALGVEHNSGGGGLYCEDFATVLMEDVILTHNTANDGPALYAEDCDVTIHGATFADNTAEDDGGALTVWFSTLTMSDVVFSDNVGLDGGAAALFYSVADIENASFERNSSGFYAGGLWQYDSTLSLTDVSFTDNVNSGANGGGLLAFGTTSLERVSFERNSANLGGGLFVYYESVVDGIDCEFDGNDPEAVYAADYSEAGGVSYDVDTWSFACAENVCADR